MLSVFSFYTIEPLVVMTRGSAFIKKKGHPKEVA